MTIKRLLFAIVATVISLSATADAPAGYYSSLNGKKEGELKTAVYKLTRNFTKVSSYTALPSYFQKTDVYPNSRQWWEMYSDETFYLPSFGGMNREHSFPKSWWGGNTSVGAYVDLNHLYPSEMKANSAKNNYPLGVVDRTVPVKFDNGVSSVGTPVASQGGGAQYVFEPDDKYKGDFARTYFYMATTYQDLTWKYTYMVDQNTYPTLNVWSVKLLLEWHHADPVSQKEIDRNEEVYKIQNNRNPFIDMPELADYIWGTKKGEAFTPGSVIVEPIGDPELIAPLKDMTIDFGQVALGNSATAKIFVKAKNISGDMYVTVYSGNKDMFNSTVTKISSSVACNEDGYWLTVNYKPGDIGVHTSRILFENSGFGSRAVTLNGECLERPVLGTCTANDATDIQPNSYTANWTAPANDVIDYFQINRTRYVGGKIFTETLVTDDNTDNLEITGFDESDSESYTVQSVRLGVMSEPSNVIFVQHSGISGISSEQPLSIVCFEGVMRFICAETQTNVRIFNAAGIEVAHIDAVAPNSDIDISKGVYLVTTAQHPTPVKALVR